jgi:hypothetical protein
MLAQHAIEAERLMVERRAHRRFTARELRGLRTARVKYGREVSVIDLSEGGVLFETTGELKPDSTIVLEFSGSTRTFLMPARVVRCQDLGTFGSNPRLESACAFRRKLPLDELVGQASPVTSATNHVAATLTGWHYVVGQYRDGRVVRGYTNDFSPARPYLHISLSPWADETKFVSIVQLDALFFLPGLDASAASSPEPAESAAMSHGRRVVVTLPDGKEMIGTTLTYNREASGFFVRPLDGHAATRVFVTQSGIRNVRFL